MHRDRFVVVLIIVCMFALCACATTKEQKKFSDAEQQDLAYQFYRENLTRHNPRAAKINVQMGMGYLERGNIEQAQRKLDLAMQQDGKSSLVLDGMAYFLESTGEPERAEIYYRQAIDYAENKGEANNNYGTFLCRQKQYTKAIDYFLTAINDTHYTTPGKAYENAGLCALKIPNKKLAEKYFLKALQKQPRSPTSLLEMGYISYDKNRYAVANNYLKRYNALVTPTSQSIWLAGQIAREIDENGQKARVLS